MSPVAMILTGITVARYPLKEILRVKSVYGVTFLRLILYPALFLLPLIWIPMPEVFATCAVCSLAMPLGLNTIVVPAALGKDTKIAAGMALVSHLCSCLTIPLVFTLFNFLMA